MAEPTAQQLARQRLAETDLTKFAPPPPKRKKDDPEPTKYTTPAVKTSAEERKAHKKAYAHAYYLAHKDEKKKRDAEYRQKNTEVYRSNSLQWYYENKDRCNARNKEWRESHKEQKLETHRNWMASHPGYYTKEQKQKRKEKRENDTERT
ncbi:MAG: hypothetical protein IKB97_05945 [Bacteroidaceae bacterium]|nr:hypothetical protein [Bacteroidaceae bacterium]MBR6317184.1 hypothetical protein [Fibrobacter sp.]